MQNGRPFFGPEECEPEMPGRTQCSYRISGSATATYIGTIRTAPGDWLAAMTEYFAKAVDDGAGHWRTPFCSRVRLSRGDGSGTLVIDETGTVTGTVFGPDAVTYDTGRVLWGSWTVDAASSGRFAGVTGSGRLFGAERWEARWDELLTGSIRWATLPIRFGSPLAAE